MRGISIRRAALVCLLAVILPHSALFSESRPAGGETLDMSRVLFGELTDNVDRPFATLPVLTLGSFQLDLHVTKHFLLMTAVALLVLASLLYLARKLRDPFRMPTRLQSLFESLLEFMRDTIYEPVLGPEGRRFHLLCFTLFLFILYGNLLGMVPPFAPIVPAEGGEAVWLGGAFTGNLASTLALGLITFIVFNVAGMRAKGVLGYWKDLIPHGTPAWMGPVTLLLEVVGIFSKTIALIMRLFANMIGGHIAILLILLLILKFQALTVGPLAVVVDLAISGLELFVAVLQAYIFSFLSALFIGMAIRKH